MDHDVEREPLPIFLRQVYLKKMSGHLYVMSRGFHISLNLIKGILVNGMSTRFDEKLPVILHLMGRISEEQYNFLGGLHQFSDDQVAEILLDHNFAKKKDIYYARIYQLRRIAISTFSLQRGKWIFTDGEPDPPLRENFEIPLAGILIEGARAIDHISYYAGKWQFHVPVLFKEIPQDIEIYFTERERDFYGAVQRQGGRNCRELIARLNILPMDFWRSILAFHLMGILEFEKKAAGGDIAKDIVALLALNQKMQGRSVSDLELLGLPAAATAAAVENARAGLLERFSPERFGSAAAPEIKKIASRVCRRLQEAMVQLEVEPLLPKQMPSPEKAQAKKTPEVEPLLPVSPLSRKFSPDAAPVAVTLTDGVHEKAWELLLRGKELYEQREFTKAIPLLKQAIKLESGQGDFYYLLGLCQSELEIMKNDAEINLKKAVEFKSWSADPVYALGILYRGQGRVKLAERCFQRVKEIAHDHTGASRELIDLRRQKAADKGKTPFLKKKIF
jgi:hypothetical protein